MGERVKFVTLANYVPDSLGESRSVLPEVLLLTMFKDALYFYQ
jgi:hypothetical protein